MPVRVTDCVVFHCVHIIVFTLSAQKRQRALKINKDKSVRFVAVIYGPVQLPNHSKTYVKVVSEKSSSRPLNKHLTDIQLDGAQHISVALHW